MLGEWGMQVVSPRPGRHDYTCQRRHHRRPRKTGKKTGVFDIIQFELRSAAESDPDELVAVTRSSFIFPRRG